MNYSSVTIPITEGQFEGKDKLSVPLANTTHLNSPDCPPKCPAPTLPSLGLSFLRLLHYEHLLAGTSILGRFQDIRTAMSYDLRQGDGPVTFIQVLQDLASMGASSRVVILTTAFLAYLKALRSQLSSIKAVFIIWWLVGAKERLEGTGNQNLISDKGLRAFADDQFSQAMGEPKAELDATIRDATLLLASRKADLKRGSNAHQLGRDQINVSLADSRMPNTALPDGAPTTLQVPPVQPGAIETLCKDVEDRGQEPIQAKVEENDHEPALGLLPSHGASEPAPTEAAGQSEPVGNGSSIAFFHAPEQATGPVDPDSSVEPLGPAQSVTVAAAPMEPPLTPRKRGDPLPVNFTINITTPSLLTGKHEGVTLRKGYTKLLLMAQANPDECGFYRYMGPDQPLVRIDEPPATSKEPMTKAKGPLAQPGAIVPDFVLPTEDIPGEDEPGDLAECSSTKDSAGPVEETATLPADDAVFDPAELTGVKSDDIRNPLDEARDQ